MRDQASTRRNVLAGILGGALTSFVPVTTAAETSLKAVAAAKGILFGSSVGAGKAGTLTGSFADARYLEILKRECAAIVPENELKAYVIAARRDEFDFDPADRIARFARDNALVLRGHTLLWNRVEFMPQWLVRHIDTLSASATEQYLRDYIRRVCTQYEDQIRSWDVVNETIDPKTGEIRQTPFTRVLGFDALRIAFEAAREYAPRAQLVYNDYMSWEVGNERHRAGVLRLLEQFRARNVPVDAFGIQSHLGNDGHIGAAQHGEWRAFIDAAVGMNYGLLITEFDVNDKDLPSDVRQRDALVAATAQAYLELMLSYRELTQVLCWGLVDSFSWLQGFSPRGDTLPQRPNPFDDAFRPKPLYTAMMTAFDRASYRSPLEPR
jgi:endo-1,4-beta-xylanase